MLQLAPLYKVSTLNTEVHHSLAGQLSECHVRDVFHCCIYLRQAQQAYSLLTCGRCAVAATPTLGSGSRGPESTICREAKVILCFVCVTVAVAH